MKGETKQRVKNLLTEGLSNKEIRERLHLSASGLNFHIAAIYKNYGLYGRCDIRRLIVLLMRERAGEK